MEKTADQLTDRERKRAKTIARILDEAHRLLREDGYTSLSMRAIASGLGMRLSNVQYYFPHMKDVLTALFTRFIDEDVGAFKTSFDAAKGSPEQRLRIAVDDLLREEAYLEECNLFMAKLTESGNGDPDVAHAIGLYYQGYSDAAAHIIDVFLPSLSPSERAERAFLIVALIEGVLRIRQPLAAGCNGRLADMLSEGILKLINK